MPTDQCPYAKSDMTPCVLADGPAAWAMNSHGDPICVGCDLTPEVLGVDRPADWAKQVADYYSQRKRNPTEADMRAFGASHEACYRWPEDTPEHKALRAAFCDGAAGAGDEIERLRALIRTLLDNDPDDMAADGVTVLDVWRQEARRAV